jgi:hypothetical protein
MSRYVPMDPTPEWDLTECSYCGHTINQNDDCACTGEQRGFIDAQCIRPHLHNTDTCDCIPAPPVVEDYEAFDITPEKVYPEGPDGWGCSSIERTIFCHNKQDFAHVRKQGRKYGRREVSAFVSA